MSEPERNDDEPKSLRDKLAARIEVDGDDDLATVVLLQEVLPALDRIEATIKWRLGLVGMVLAEVTNIYELLMDTLPLSKRTVHIAQQRAVARERLEAALKELEREEKR